MDEKEMIMPARDLLLGAVAAGLLFSSYAAPAFAEKGGNRPRTAGMLEHLDTDKDGKVTLAEFKANASAAFKAFDADGDGKVTPAEISARHDAFIAARKALRASGETDRQKARDALRAAGPFMLPGAGRTLDRADTDRNGSLSEAEVLAASERLFKRLDRNGDGFVVAHGKMPKAGKKVRHKGSDQAQRGERMIQRLDVDGDGKVSQAEMLQRAAETFQRFDADGDGKVTKAEIDAKRKVFHDARKAYREIKATKGKGLPEARNALREARLDSMAGRLFGRAGADRSAVFTKAEIEASTAATFKQRDRNGDGFLTADELGRRYR